MNRGLLLALVGCWSGCVVDLSSAQGDTRDPRTTSVELEEESPVVGTVSQARGTAILLELDGPLPEGRQAIELVWTTRDVVSAEIEVVDGYASVETLLPDPCAQLGTFAQAVIRATDGAWSTVVGLDLAGWSVDTDLDTGPVPIDGEPVALCGSARRIDLWVSAPGPYAFDVRGEAIEILAHHDEATANLSSTLALAYGQTRLEVTAPSGYTVVIAPY